MRLLSFSQVLREINPIFPFEYLPNAPQAHGAQKTPVGIYVWSVLFCYPLKGGSRTTVMVTAVKLQRGRL